MFVKHRHVTAHHPTLFLSENSQHLGSSPGSASFKQATCHEEEWGEACPTSGNAHVGSHLESWVDVDHCAPHHLTAEVSRDELHGGRQVVPGLVALVRVVICVVKRNM